ncbi:MAG: formylglycine-generating enzyme family protein [Byssovorax sp.]
MRWIRAGRFLMGSPGNERGRFEHETQHEVVLTRGYWMADTPVTQALWEAVMGENPSEFKGAYHPVERVSWSDCQMFMARANEKVSELFVRLPTEAEWEYACRGGTTGATWAGELDDVGNKASVLDPIAWYAGNSPRSTHPVAEKAANPYGLYDMLGNVWEWCEDWADRYKATKDVDPAGPENGSDRVSRGGSLTDEARYVRAAYRNARSPDFRNVDLGFRLARSLTPSQSGGAP